MFLTFVQYDDAIPLFLIVRENRAAVCTKRLLSDFCTLRCHFTIEQVTLRYTYEYEAKKAAKAFVDLSVEPFQ